MDNELEVMTRGLNHYLNAGFEKAGFSVVHSKLRKKKQKSVLLARHTCKLAFMIGGGIVHAYGHGVRGLAPQFYKAQLDAFDTLTQKYGIPYDPQFQNDYLSSFGGALFAVPLMQVFLSNGAKETELFQNSPLQHSQITTRNAFVGAAAALTVREIYDSYQDTTVTNVHGQEVYIERTFDTGDMTAYGLALVLYACALKAVTNRAIKKVTANTPKP